MKTKQHISGRFLLVFSLFFLLCGTVKTSAATAPGRIQGLKCGITTKNSVNLSWQGQSGISGYQIYRSMAYDGQYTRVKNINPSMNAFCNKKLLEGQEYYYKVRSYISSPEGIAYGKFSKIRRTSTKKPFSQNAIVCKRANLRKHAGTNHPVITTLDEGASVTVLVSAQDKEGGAWNYISCFINNRTVKGYIYSNLLQKQQASVRQYGKVTALRLNVRTNAGTNYPVIASLKKGKKVILLGQKKAADFSVWYLIQVKQKGKSIQGYVSSRYIKPV